MLIDLDDDLAQDPGRTGAKAAWLARAKRAGLPVLPGLVVPADLSRSEMRRGAEAMDRRGPGGALLTVTNQPMSAEVEASLHAAAEALGGVVVVRSSSVLESSGAWSGAFTSYLDVGSDQVAKAVRGCWASAFTVHTLERYSAAELDPGSVPMAVLIQPALAPDFGGVARLAGEDVTVTGVAGSPAPLVQGWDPGAHARVPTTGTVTGESALELMGEALIAEVASVLRRAHELTGANACEWASVGGTVTLLQLMKNRERPPIQVDIPPAFRSPVLAALARLVRRYPGPLGEELVLPWAIAAPAGFLTSVEPLEVEPLDALLEAIERSRSLVASVWNSRKSTGLETAIDVVRGLRSDAVGGSVAKLATLRVPDPDSANAVLRLLETARRGLVAAGAVTEPSLAWHFSVREAIGILRSGGVAAPKTRIGFDRWEPFDLATVIGQGKTAEAIPAAGGLAVGRMCWVSDPFDVPHFRPRDVVVGSHPLPNLAALLWDASAVVTTGGGPAAHLFESARALGIPAVAGLDLEGLIEGDPERSTGTISLAVDGSDGRVWATDW